jgi:hypothetical protein
MSLSSSYTLVVIGVVICVYAVRHPCNQKRCRVVASSGEALELIHVPPVLHAVIGHSFSLQLGVTCLCWSQ